ncbi:MAG: hypothetical protein Q9174_004502, partial [Haloplaca sp. 1 TL-2023]
MGESHPASDQLLLSTVTTSAQSFLQPTSALHAAALVVAKRYLDPVASSTTEAQAERLRAQRQKRKRGQLAGNTSSGTFRIRQVHLEGFKTQQVWEQARRVLDASTQEAWENIQNLLPQRNGEQSHNDEDQGGKRPAKRVRFDDGQSGEDKTLQPVSNGQATDDDGGVREADVDELSGSDVAPGEHDEEELEELNGENDDIYMDSEASSDVGEEPNDEFVADKHGLNDGFFSIDDFNKQSDFLESQDARGVPEDDASDEEEIDWAAEPPPMPVEENASEEDDEENGPTFGNADLNASDSDPDDSGEEMPMDNMGLSSNTNDIMYADFFSPPARKATKSTRRRPLPKTQPSTSSAPPQEDDIDRTIDAVRRDIFEDDLSAGDESDAGAALDPGDPSSRRSNHERRQAKLAEEIRRLEAANVAKRDWTLSGEARAADRPLNSLLEEDLDFERAGKPVPVITNEVSEDIEALIKRRIINREFDEVIRRRPGNLATGAQAARRGRFELDDTKPQQSLAEIYETEHLKKTDPAYVDKRDEKLKKEHAAIESL